MKKIFVISWYFPPINSSEGLVTFKLLKNSKYEYDVYTQKNSIDWAYNNTENKLISNNINTIFSECVSTEEWIKEGIKYFDKNRDKYDIVMTRSMPPESHEIGLAIKRKYNDIIWIASYGDPISNNPYNKIYYKTSPYKVLGNGLLDYKLSYVLSPKRILKNIYWNYRDKKYKKTQTRYYKDIVLNENIIKYADKLIMNNKYESEYIMRDFRQFNYKVCILYHSYDEEFYDYSLKKSTEKIVISYVGHCDEIRTPKSFILAVDRLNKKIKDLSEKLEINFYGNIDNKDKVLIMDCELYDIIKIHKPITYLESLNVMVKSDWLLLIDANLSNFLEKNIFFAAKIADYIGSKKNIFAITMADGASAEILRNLNQVISSFSVDDIYMQLMKIINKKDAKLKNVDIEEYNAINISKKFDKLIKEQIRSNYEKQ